MSKLKKLICFYQIFAHFEVDASETFVKSWDKGNERIEKLCNAKINHLVERLTNNEVYW